MAATPFFPFFYQDFLTGTRFFTNEQTGAYIRLLLDQWDLVILKEKHFATRLCGISKEECNEIRAKFRPVSIQNTEGFQNEKMEIVRKSVNKRSKIARQNGKLGGISKASKRSSKDGSKPLANDLANEKLPNPNPNPNPNLKTKSKSKPKKGGVGGRKSLTSWPEGFELDELMIQYAERKGVKDPADEFEAFRNWADQSEKLFKDWKAAWRTRCDNYAVFSGNKKTSTEGGFG